MHQLSYHLRLALRDLRRNAGLSWAVFAGLALATAIWTTAICHFLRFHGDYPRLDPALHQVEIIHSRTPTGPTDWGTDSIAAIIARTQVSYPEFRILSQTGVPSQQAASLRARVLVALGPAAPAQTVPARFASADFFSLFRLGLRDGRVFSQADEASLQPVVVLGKKLEQRLFPRGDSVGHHLLIEGQAFRIVGVLAEHQPPRPVWDVGMTGARQDALYLPFGWWQSLLVRPEAPLIQAPVGPHLPDLLRSPALFVSYWNVLPDQASRLAYQRHLDRHLTGPGRPGYRLRDYASWQAEFAMPFSDVRFFTTLTGLILLAAGFNAARLLLAKGLARRRELGIHRALGASRLSVFARQMLEALLLTTPAGLLGVLLAVPYVELFNHLVDANDVPVTLTPDAFVRGFVPALLVGLTAAVYPAWRLSRTGPSGRQR